MSKTAGDKLFERYLLENSYEPGPHEPELGLLGVRTKPDFVASRDGMKIAFEVKQFEPGASKLEKRLHSQRTISASPKEVLGPIRNQVREAARQLKPLHTEGFPLVVVITNPLGALVNLRVRNVLEALYGDVNFTFQVDSQTGQANEPGHFEYGRNGKLTNDHPYLSGIVLLRQRDKSADRIEAISSELQGSRPPRTWENAADEAAVLIERIQQETLPEGDYLYCDVIETVSDSATRIPDELLNGARDTRWRLGSDGYFASVDS